MNTKQVGELSEAVVLTHLLKMGLSVSKPFGDNQRYDLISDDNGRLTRIQVKTGRLVKGKIVANATRTNSRKRYSSSEIDAFVIYCEETNGIYMIPAREVTTTDFCLRVTPTKNFQNKNIIWADKYKI